MAATTQGGVFTDLWRLAKTAVGNFATDRAASMGAALAYYTAFSVVPLLVIVISVAGLVFGRDAARTAVIDELRDLIGPTGATAIRDMLMQTSDVGTGLLTTAVGLVVLLIGATTAFAELQDDLDRIWKAEPRAGSGIVNLFRSRLLSFGMVLSIGFLLTVSLVLSAVIAALGPSLLANGEVLLHAINFVASLAVITVLFAMIYKILPNVHIAWGDVWVGAGITALLFAVGKELIGFYIGKSSVASSFGAAGPFVIIMVWIYYSTQIFLFGAEFAHAYAHRHDPPAPGAGAAAPRG
ncbi:MAG TPA: YihY/virulence factor BrkB family protein [Casimicrobiaceae bacterium]|nr:YihY/virulence factor BrkB family protein [Casimicrobiaceae bacterium]